MVVSKEGFPIAYDVFFGNTFKGHTIILVINDFIKRNSVKEFTLVADAAMISTENVKQLKENHINYFVGARLANIPAELLDDIDKTIKREDGKSIRINTKYVFLICSYSSIRYRKDLYEMSNQIEKANHVISNPSKSKKLKFTKANGQKIELNVGLIDKTKKLLGIKGYYTNLEESVVDKKTIIDRYHELYKFEQAFRISKGDLETRRAYPNSDT